MTIAQLIPLAIQVSMGLIVLSIGLQVSPADMAPLLRRPGYLVRAVLAMNVFMPVLAMVLAMAFDLNPAVEGALIALALAPVPPILPNKELKAGGLGSSIVAPASGRGAISHVAREASSNARRSRDW